MLIALCYLVNTVLSYLGVDTVAITYIAGMSVLPTIFLYISSYVFDFCAYHRMFLHYIVVNTIIQWIDYYFKIPLSDKEFLVMIIAITCIMLFIGLILYVKDHKRAPTEDSGEY